MRFIKFKQATTKMEILGEGDIHFVIDGATGVMCVELTEGDIAKIRANQNRLFVLTPLQPTLDRPVYIKLFPSDPFVKTPTNGQG
jgi:hypothetical protein